MTTITELLEPYGFEELNLDEELVPCLDLPDTRTYAIVSDMDGLGPTDSEEPLLFTIYNEEDAFQWSVTLENIHTLLDIIQDHPTWSDRLDALKEKREQNFIY